MAMTIHSVANTQDLATLLGRYGLTLDNQSTQKLFELEFDIKSEPEQVTSDYIKRLVQAVNIASCEPDDDIDLKANYFSKDFEVLSVDKEDRTIVIFDKSKVY